MIYFQIFTTFRYKSLKNSEKCIGIHGFSPIEASANGDPPHDVGPLPFREPMSPYSRSLYWANRKYNTAPYMCRSITD